MPIELCWGPDSGRPHLSKRRLVDNCDALKQGGICINVICHDLLRHEQSHESGIDFGFEKIAG